jgi:hypothetical protein
MAEQTPIIVTDNTLEGQVSTLLRYLLASGGAFALGKGWIDDATLQFLTALVTVALPMGWGLWKTYQSKKTNIIAGLYAPNDIVQVVHK